jgi:hypothetical protein
LIARRSFGDLDLDSDPDYACFCFCFCSSVFSGSVDSADSAGVAGECVVVAAVIFGVALLLTSFAAASIVDWAVDLAGRGFLGN